MGYTRFGAILERILRSRKDSRTISNSILARYLSPPWMSFEVAEEVAHPKSFFSIRATDKPREAASYATVAPVMPPPIIMRSNFSPE